MKQMKRMKILGVTFGTNTDKKGVKIRTRVEGIFLIPGECRGNLGQLYFINEREPHRIPKKRG